MLTCEQWQALTITDDWRRSQNRRGCPLLNSFNLKEIQFCEPLRKGKLIEFLTIPPGDKRAAWLEYLCHRENEFIQRPWLLQILGTSGDSRRLQKIA